MLSIQDMQKSSFIENSDGTVSVNVTVSGIGNSKASDAIQDNQKSSYSEQVDGSYKLRIKAG